MSTRPDALDPATRASRPERLVIGLDVGSTTVKAVCVDPGTRSILWSDYQRHEARQAEKAIELLAAGLAAVPGVPEERVRLFLTGSGARPLCEALGGAFVQEVNAVTLAVETLHPDVGSVVELGGQDAKIIIFQPTGAAGGKQAVCSMNDKCASGTGATIDKCMIKVGLPQDEVSKLRFDPTKLHKVAAKCGVFAETDIVNLIKAGIPANEVICSLADAIVGQNLSVLTRGSTLRHKVLLLGGPNTYLPFLRDCWRLRIPETWKQRGYAVPDVPVEDLILVPQQAQYYAAYGAVLYGLEEPESLGRFRGLEPLRALVAGRGGQVRERSGAALAPDPAALAEFRRRYTIPRFVPRPLAPGETVRGVVGLDGGSTSSKAVLVSDTGEVLVKAYRLSKGNPVQDMQDLLADLSGHVERQGARLEVTGMGVTGYAADVLDEALLADANVVETVAHMRSALHFFEEVDVICDIGGQDIKVLMMRDGEIKNFRLSNQCSAGNGMLLQGMASQFAVPLEQYADVAFQAKSTPTFSYGCAVFLDSDRVNFQREGYDREQLLAGLAMVLPKNVWQYVVQIPRLAELGTRFVLQGGTQYNLAAVKAQVDYICARVPGADVRVHPHCGEAGAIGAAIEALRVVSRRGSSRFIGLASALGLEYSTRNDEVTRCRFCPNLCGRTFVDTRTPDGRTSRYISGFSCEKGTVESKEAMLELVKHRNALKEQHVNLVEYEARLAFRRFYEPAPLPAEGSPLEAVEARRTLLGGVRRKAVQRGFLRSSPEAAERRRKLRIGVPRVLNLYSTAPLFRSYFETLGIPSANVCFSEPTNEEMYREGAKYGSIDPCFPSKLTQAHLHALLFHVHRPGRLLDYIFFPSLTHVPTFVKNSADSTSCPVVAGTPNVMKAAFTKEKDFFAERGIDYVDGALTLSEPHYLAEKMFEMWGARLGVTRDESDFAMAQGWNALRQLDREMERRGLEVLERVEAENKLAILLLARPYHADPGVNHGILDEFQALGYPVLTIRSIPKDEAWLARWFRDDLEQGRVTTPLDVTDVWPENYSANSVQKVWAAKFAARHPHVAVLDLSSFKCGHDAPTYGLIDDIIKGGKKPYLALHDIDANKPAGSQKIRVKTFAYTLARYEEELADRAAKRSELERRVAAERARLLSARRAAQRARTGGAEALDRELDEMDRAFHQYLAEEERVFGLASADFERPFPAEPPGHRATDDVAPLPVSVQVLERPGPRAASAGGCGSGACGSGCQGKAQ